MVAFVRPRLVAVRLARAWGRSASQTKPLPGCVGMEIKVLGCHGSQLPGHGFTGFLVNQDTLLDAGTVTSVLSLEEQSGIQRILVTHAHLDHVREIASLADNVSFLPREAPIEVVGTASVLEALRRHIFNGTIWPDFSRIPSPERPILRFVPITTGAAVVLGGLKVTAIPVQHVVETVAYVIETTGAGPVRTAVFVGDTGPTEAIWEVVRQADHIGAVFLEISLPAAKSEIAGRAGHLTPDGLAGELKKLGPHPPPVYLYHMKLPCRGLIQQEIAPLLNERLRILEDGQVIRL